MMKLILVEAFLGQHWPFSKVTSSPLTFSPPFSPPVAAETERLKLALGEFVLLSHRPDTSHSLQPWAGRRPVPGEDAQWAVPVI